MKFSKNHNKLVNFVVGGVQKGGTTALYTYLNEHPNICMATQKELHFFDNERFFLNKPDYTWYHSFFNPNLASKLLGEATPIYIYWKNSPQHILEYNPNMKWILTLRNPIDRAFSHWNMERSRGKENFSFWDAIQNEEERCKSALPYQHRIYSYTSRGFYLEQLKRLWQHFPKKNILILKYENLKNEPQQTLINICDFLEINHFDNVNIKNIFSTPYETEMSQAEKKYLYSLFENEILAIEHTLGWDCSDWLQK